MSWDQIEGNWKQFKGNVKQQWDDLASDHSNIITGKRDKLAGKIQEASAKEYEMIKEEILPRRAVLRGALAVGCGLCLPIVFSGCDSNKGANSTSSAPASSPTSSTSSAAPAATGKVPQASVQYQTQPKGELRCRGCMNFIAESNTCKLVDGQISPFPLLARQLTIRGYTLFEISTNPQRLARAKEFILKGLNAGKLKPTVAKFFPLENVVEAHQYMESNQQIGKIVLTV